MTAVPQLIIRPARPDDAPLLHALIRELAAHTGHSDAVQTTPEVLRAQLASERPPFECVVASWEGEPAGMALFFPNYSTWRGQPGLYLEDLIVRPAFRRKGVGRALLAHLADVATARGYARVEWCVYDSNARAIEFYRALGAEPQRGLSVFRLTGDALARLGAG